MRCRRYFRDIICGLAYLHVHGVVHCDLKPQNLFRTNDDHIKIADFGASMFDKGTGIDGSFKMMKKEEEQRRLSSESPASPRGGRDRAVTGGGASVGTPFFMAPELFESSDSGVMEKLVQPAVDIWSLGATLYMLVCGRPPWMGKNELELAHKIELVELTFPPEVLGVALDPHIKSMIRKVSGSRPN